jgi:tetratricopeptide (TPR) repeat protein
MTSESRSALSRIPDPIWTAADYVRFADHEAPEVRCWALTRIQDLELEVPIELVRRRLSDVDEAAASLAADLAGRRRMGGLAEELLARLERSEDSVGAACAQALADLRDHRLLEPIRRRQSRAIFERDPRIWLALSELKTPEAAMLLAEALDRLPAGQGGLIASILAGSLMLADPADGIPRVVRVWVEARSEERADALLDALLTLAEFPDGADGLRAEMQSDREASWPGLPEALLDDLGKVLPLGLVGEARRAYRKGKWGRAIETLSLAADTLTERGQGLQGVAVEVALVQAIAGQARGLTADRDKGWDAVGLMLLALTRIAEKVSARALIIPDTPEEQLRWLLGETAVSHPDMEALLLERLARTTPSQAWVLACLQTIEGRTPQAAAAADLLGVWRAEAAVPGLIGALGDRDDEELASAAADALAAIGGPAVDALTARLGSTEDPVVLEECLEICLSLPSWRVVRAICQRFEALFIHVPEKLSRIVQRIGAREFLDPLGRELREGETEAEGAFAFLCTLHKVSDPRLGGIRGRQAERVRRLADLTEEAAAREGGSIEVALRCTGCQRTYTFTVREVYVDPEAPEEEPPQFFIKDPIRCKGCGRVDEYTIPGRTQLQLMAELDLLMDRMEEEGADAVPRGPIRFLRMGLSDGRRMSPREARRDYESRLATRPGDPDLLIGYANILRFLGEREQAEVALRRTIELDPTAVDAHATLGQLAEEQGDLVSAEGHYRRCMELGRRGRFYRVKDRRAFLEWIDEALLHIRGELAARPPEPIPAQARLETLVRQDLAGPRVGRNDPCPCGSGKKFKKCCLLTGESASGHVPSQRADNRLRDRLVDYVQRTLPPAEMRRAMREYFGERPDREAASVSADPSHRGAEWGAFLEWFIHDFRLSTGRPPIAVFLAQRGQGLPAEERGILAEWQETAVTLHEIVDLEPGKSLTLRDVFTDETVTVREVRGSLSAARWDLFSARVIRIHGEPFLAGAITVFHQSDRENLVRHVTERYETYRSNHPGASWQEFFRAESLVFHRYAEEQARNYRLPKLHTAEGHPLRLGRLRYEVRDTRRLLAALAAAPDFTETAEPDELAEVHHFAWLRQGPAERYVKETSQPTNGLMITSQQMDATGAAGIPGLATLELSRSELKVETLSAERLAWVKARLADMAGDLLSLRADVIEDPSRMIEAARSAQTEAPPHEIPPEIETRLTGQMLQRHFTAWLDEKIPALNGRTPRAAARDPKLRPKVIQLLREIENHQDRARQQGRPWYDIGWVWRELKIGHEEA